MLLLCRICLWEIKPEEVDFSLRMLTVAHANMLTNQPKIRKTMNMAGDYISV